MGAKYSVFNRSISNYYDKEACLTISDLHLVPVDIPEIAPRDFLVHHSSKFTGLRRLPMAFSPHIESGGGILTSGVRVDLTFVSLGCQERRNRMEGHVMAAIEIHSV